MRQPISINDIFSQPTEEWALTTTSVKPGESFDLPKGAQALGVQFDPSAKDYFLLAFIYPTRRDLPPPDAGRAGDPEGPVQ